MKPLKTFGLAFFVLVSSCGCAMLREGNTVTTPGPAFGPCGSWVDCGADQPKDDRCCPPTTVCRQRDDDRFCTADPSYDPADPVTWGATKRIARSATGK